MRIFLQFHRSYHYLLTEQQIRDALQQALGMDYSFSQCVADLDYLIENGNITTVYDWSKRATSVASFYQRALLYQATPEAIELEEFLDRQLRNGTRHGSLDQSNLPLLYDLLQEIDKEFQPDFAVHEARAQRVAERWQNAFQIWETMARNAAGYLRTISDAAQQGGSDLDSYLAYKKAVVRYIHGFANFLSLYSRDIRELLQEWASTGKKERLIELVVLHRRLITPEPEQQAISAELIQTVQNQVEMLTDWFATGKNTDTFQRNASTEVEKVVRRAFSLGVAARSQINYAIQLDAFARHLLKVSSAEIAQQLFTTAFPCAVAVHFPENLAGLASIEDRTNSRNVWDLPPTVPLRLWPLGAGNRGERRLEDPIGDYHKDIQRLKARYQQRDEAHQQRFSRLFDLPILDLGMIDSLDPETRNLLEEILDICLSDTVYHRCQALDGSFILLLNHEEKERVSLKGPDGVLRLPRYRLQRQTVSASKARTT